MANSVTAGGEQTTVDYPIMISRNFSWETGAEHTSKDLITAEIYETFNKYWVGLRILICIGGMCTNVVNIRTFIKMGIDDSIMIAFFVLAISDFCYLFDACLSGFCMVVVILAADFVLWFPVHPFTLYYFTAITASTFKEVSMFMVTFLAVQRSLCVIRPLHFRGLFTKLRTYVVVGVFWTYCFTMVGILLSQTGVQSVMDPVANRTTVVLLYRPNFKKIVDIMYIVSGLIVNLTREVIVMASVAIMAYALTKSLNFRKMASASSSQPGTAVTSKPDDSKDSQGRDDNTKTSSPKERQAIMQVTLVCVIFLVSNTPLVVISIAGLVFTEFKLQGAYHYTFTTVTGIMDTIELLNAAVNFFVYYTYNTKFKELCSGSNSSNNSKPKSKSMSKSTSHTDAKIKT